MRFGKPLGCVLLFLFTIACAFGGEPVAAQSPVVCNIPPAYGEWQIKSYPGWWTGSRNLLLVPGEYLLSGKLGWQLKVRFTEDHNLLPVSTQPGRCGRDLSGLFCYRNTLSLPQPIGQRVVFAIPQSAGEYAIDGLLDKGKGLRAAFLPEGESILKGAAWAVCITVKGQTISASWQAKENDNGVVEPRPNLVVKENVVIYPPEPIAPPSMPQKALLGIHLERGRKIFRRDERIAVSVSLQLLEAQTHPFALRIAQNNNRLTLVDGNWSAGVGRQSRIFEFTGEVAGPGKWKLEAAFGDLSASVPLAIAPADEELLSSIDLVCLDTADAAKPTADRGATVMLASHPQKANLLQRLSDAASLGLRVWLDNHEGKRLFNPYMPAESSELMLLRSNALLAQRTRPFSNAVALLQSGNNPGAMPESVFASGRRGAKFASDTLQYALSINAQAEQQIPDADIVMADLRQYKGGAFAYFREHAERFAKNRAVYAVQNAQDGWLALACGARGLAVDKRIAKDTLESMSRIGDLLQELPPLKLSADILDSSTADHEREETDRNRGGVPMLTKGLKTVYGFPFSAGSCLGMWVFNYGDACIASLDLAGCDIQWCEDAIQGGTLDLDNTGAPVSIPLEKNAVRLYLFARRNPAAFSVTAERVRRRSSPRTLRYDARLVDESRRGIDVTIPACITIRNPQGETRLQLWRVLRNGRTVGELPLAITDPEGEYTVTVAADAAGVTGSATGSIPLGPNDYDAVVREWTALEIEDRTAVRQLYANMKAPLIVPGKAAHVLMAMDAVAYLRSRGQEAELAVSEELMQQRFNTLDGRTRALFNTFGPKCRIDRPVILLHTPGANPLVEEILNTYALAPFSVTSEIPGRGRGLVQAVWRPFSPEHDAIVISGSDLAGLQAATDFFLRRLR